MIINYASITVQTVKLFFFCMNFICFWNLFANKSNNIKETNEQIRIYIYVWNMFSSSNNCTEFKLCARMNWLCLLMMLADLLEYFLIKVQNLFHVRFFGNHIFLTITKQWIDVLECFQYISNIKDWKSVKVH